MTVTNQELQQLIETFDENMDDQRFNTRQRFHDIEDDNPIDQPSQKVHWLEYLTEPGRQHFNLDDILVNVKCAPMWAYLLNKLGVDTTEVIEDIRNTPLATTRKFSIMTTEKHQLMDSYTVDDLETLIRQQ